MYFQDIITTLNNFWANKDCCLMQPYDTEVGAGTLSPLTALYTLTQPEWNIAYVQASRRPKDARYGENPNRLGHYYQYQVIMKPSPDNIQNLYLESLSSIGLTVKNHDIRFVEDDWENPTIGAWGLGWEVWCDGMEVSQFTFMQQIGGVECFPVPAEITYGLERLAMYIQGVDDINDIQWNEHKKYGDIHLSAEKQFSGYFHEFSSADFLQSDFDLNSSESSKMIERGLPLPAYHFCLKACHIFNMLDARGVISVTERAKYITKVRDLARRSIKLWVDSNAAK
jgi:glycyl-tRNA synthetase alpha chain